VGSTPAIRTQPLPIADAQLEGNPTPCSGTIKGLGHKALIG